MYIAVLLPRTGCDSLKKNVPAAIKIKRIPAKLIVTALDIGIEVLLPELADLGISGRDILATVFSTERAKGLPAGDIAVLMLINKASNDVYYWKLTENVRMIRLKNQNPGPIELKIINETSLRIELWMDSPVNTEVVIEMKE